MTHDRSDAYELFISYARKDNAPRRPTDAIGWVESLRSEILSRHRGVSTAPLRFFFDGEDIHGMQDWRHRILLGLQRSKILLVCLSPEYFRSDNCLWEWEEFHRHKASRLIGHESVAPVYFVEAPDTDEQAAAAFRAFVERGEYRDEEMPTFIPRWKEWHAAVRRFNHYDFRPWFPDGSAALAEDDVRRRLDELAGDLTDRIAGTRRAAGVPGNVRGYNPHFVGRSTQFLQLHERLIKDGAVGVVTAVNGLGGQGKTEFAVTYAHSHADAYPGGLWLLGAEGRTELLPLFGECAGDARLGIPISAGPEETPVQCGLRVLARMKELSLAAREQDSDGGASCLVILDNVSEPALLAKPQRSQLPKEDWLRLVATTRLGPDRFPASQRELHFMEMASLDEEDAVDLIRNHQPPRDPDGLRSDFARPAEDEPSVRAIVRELGGFTLAVESVAIYLGLHPEIRPADYLIRLRTEGLTSVDELPADLSVADQMHHREKQLRLVLDQTLATLTPPERSAIEYAAFLPPDSIPWPWLRDLVVAEHQDSLATRPGYPEPWTTLRRHLEGLRLLTPGNHSEVARMHRMVGVHVRERLKARDALIHGRLRSAVEKVALKLQEDCQHDPAMAWQLGPLQEVVRHWRADQLDAGLGLIAGVVGSVEMRVGRIGVAHEFLQLATEVHEAVFAAEPSSKQAGRDALASLSNLARLLDRRGLPGDAERAIGYCELSLEIAEQLLKASPVSEQAARHVSVGLGQLAGLLDRRGLPGDAERALRYCERSLEISARLLEASSASVQAAQDLSVSLVQLADLLMRRGLPGDTKRALDCYKRSLEVRERILEANPGSTQAMRDVSASLERFADLLLTRGLSGDTERALEYYERSLEIREKILKANPSSAEAARDVSVGLYLLADLLTTRGLPGDAERALANYERSLEISEANLKVNPKSGEAERDVSVRLERLADFLAIRGPHRDAGRALGYYERSLDVRERLLNANPGSRQAERDVLVSLFWLADLLAERSLPGDVERAVGYCERSLEVSERLWKANPESAQEAHDVMISLERFARVMSCIADSQASRRALELQVRALNIALGLREMDPQSGLYGRSVATSYVLTYERASAVGEHELAARCLVGCHAVLHEQIKSGFSLDAAMIELYRNLTENLGEPGRRS